MCNIVNPLIGLSLKIYENSRDEKLFAKKTNKQTNNKPWNAGPKKKLSVKAIFQTEQLTEQLSTICALQIQQ